MARDNPIPAIDVAELHSHFAELTLENLDKISAYRVKKKPQALSFDSILPSEVKKSVHLPSKSISAPEISSKAPLYDYEGPISTHDLDAHSPKKEPQCALEQRSPLATVQLLREAASRSTSSGGESSPAAVGGGRLTPSVQARMAAFHAKRSLSTASQDEVSPIISATVGRQSSSSQITKSLGKRRGMTLGSVMPPDLRENNLFGSFSDYLDVEAGTLQFKDKLILHASGVDFSSGQSFRIERSHLTLLEEIGRGNYGTVHKVVHNPTKVVMAVKQIRLELDESKLRMIVMELDVLHKAVSPYIVEFYGAFFVETQIYICMEYMDGGSLEGLYGDGIEEHILNYITYCVVSGLKTLKDEHNIIHRDVKPTNILVNKKGDIKLCDFGVSGNLVASIARTNIGCQSYMAPERICTEYMAQMAYTVQSDIWSLGLTILELAKGTYPYPPETYNNIFAQLSAIVDGEPPHLADNQYSKEAVSFVASCLNKVPRLRPSYATLLSHPWIKFESESLSISKHLMIGWVNSALLRSKRDSNKHIIRPALHRQQFGTIIVREPLHI